MRCFKKILLDYGGTIITPGFSRAEFYYYRRESLCRKTVSEKKGRFFVYPDTFMEYIPNKKMVSFGLYATRWYVPIYSPHKEKNFSHRFIFDSILKNIK